MPTIRVRQETKTKLEEVKDAEGHSDLNGVIQALLTVWEMNK